MSIVSQTNLSDYLIKSISQSFITISAKEKRPPIRSSQRFTVGKDILNKKTRERKKKKENKNDEKSEYYSLTAEWVGCVVSQNKF